MAECIFDQIGSGKIPSDVVYQDDTVMAFNDIHPKAPVHVLIIPKKHIASLVEVTQEELPIVGHMIEVANIVAKKKGISSYKLVVNNGKDAGQAIMHLHMHLLSGRQLPGPV